MWGCRWILLGELSSGSRAGILWSCLSLCLSPSLLLYTSRVDQIVGKGLKDVDATDDGSMMGRLGKVEKQVRRWGF